MVAFIAWTFAVVYNDMPVSVILAGYLFIGVASAVKVVREQW